MKRSYRWFAWRPVRNATTGRLVWMRWIKRWDFVNFGPDTVYYTVSTHWPQDKGCRT